GPFQIGKSSTFNNILGVTQDESPSPEGGTGAATSSTITRLYVQQDGNGQLLKLTYLTPAQYQAKRDSLCKAAGFHDFSDDQVLQLIPQRIREFHSGKAPGDVGLSDLELLQKFLLSYKNLGGQFVRAVPVQTTLPFSKEARDKYLMHDRQVPF